MNTFLIGLCVVAMCWLTIWIGSGICELVELIIEWYLNRTPVINPYDTFEHEDDYIDEHYINPSLNLHKFYFSSFFI